MKPVLFLVTALGLAACAGFDDGDPRTQLEKNLDVPIELAGQIHPARLAHLKFVEDNDDIYTTYEQQKIRRQVLSGQRGLTINF